MKLDVSRNCKKYEINLEQISQWPGIDFDAKRFIIKSLEKYFSNGKYYEYDMELVDNIYIEGEVVGRKYFQFFSISTRDSLINMIKLSKTSLMNKYIKYKLLQFDCIKELEEIENNLDTVFRKLNILSVLQENHIELHYEPENLFGMVQHSDIRTGDGGMLEQLSNKELLTIFIALWDEVQQLEPQKSLLVFENIDHLLHVDEYKEFVVSCREKAKKYDNWFVFTTSIDGFVMVEEDLIEGITILNEIKYSLPSFEILNSFADYQYPYNKNWEKDELVNTLEKIIPYIGRKEIDLEIKNGVLLKLINKTLCIDTTMKKCPSEMEISFLMPRNMI